MRDFATFGSYYSKGSLAANGLNIHLDIATIIVKDFDCLSVSDEVAALYRHVSAVFVVKPMSLPL